MNEQDRNRPLYMIGVAAELAGMHPQTLRSYEQKGLVTPQRTRGNTRMYSQADIERLELINELTDEGINLAGVIRILDLQGRLAERDQELDDLHRRVRRLADRVHELETHASVASLMAQTTTLAIRKRKHNSISSIWRMSETLFHVLFALNLNRSACVNLVLHGRKLTQ